MAMSFAEADSMPDADTLPDADAMAEAQPIPIAEAAPNPIAENTNSYGQASNYSNEDEGYGKTWMYIPDGNGVPQIAYLKEESTPSRGRDKNIKEHVRFELYTK